MKPLKRYQQRNIAKYLGIGGGENMKLTNISDQSKEHIVDLEEGNLFRAPTRNDDTIYQKSGSIGGKVIVSEREEKIGNLYEFGEYELVREVEIVDVKFKDK